VAPLLPALHDEQLPKVQRAAAEAGASGAAYTLLRLPGSVNEIFSQAHTERLPHKAESVVRRTREVRAGRLNDPRFHHRQRGNGPYAAAIQRLFTSEAERLGLGPPSPSADATFRRPNLRGQLSLFECPPWLGLGPTGVGFRRPCNPPRSCFESALAWR
jgi:DNA repair photolyase